jgi:hypothetical protein
MASKATMLLIQAQQPVPCSCPVMVSLTEAYKRIDDVQFYLRGYRLRDPTMIHKQIVHPLGVGLAFVC